MKKMKCSPQVLLIPPCCHFGASSVDVAEPYSKNDAVSSSGAGISFDAVLRRCSSSQRATAAPDSSVVYAVTKSSRDPRGDFRVSMVEMISSEKKENGMLDLKALLFCFLALNHVSYHGIIYDVFIDVCSDLF